MRIEINNDVNDDAVGRVGNEEITITDVTEEVISKMTADELDRYNQVYQDFYSNMYE